MDDPFEGMAVFVRVMEAGSFTRAAAELELTKSTVSEAVRRLETRLGIRLLNRTTRRVAPTEAGQAYFHRARKALEEAKAASSEAGALNEEPIGRLRVATPEAFTRGLITPLLPDMLAAWPDLQVEFVEGVAPVDLLEAGVDLAIRIATVLEDNLIVRRLGSSRVVIAAAPAYLSARGIPRHPSELPMHNTIGFTPMFWGHEWRFLRGGEAINVPIRPVVLTNAAETLRGAALAGVGLTAMPSWMIIGELSRGDLVEVLTDWRTTEYGIYAVYPSNRLMAKKVKLFADLVARRIRECGLDVPRRTAE
ncbi:MAG: LysR substrate-binding domain-containing protein [Micropepsaceae bacterium]